MTNREAIDILEEVKAFDDSMYAYNPAYTAALDKAIDSLRAASNTSCDDTISRKAAIDAQCDMFCGSHIDCRFYPKCDNLKPLQDLPSAQPDLSSYNDKLWIDERSKAEAQRMRGRWKALAGIYECSECGAAYFGMNNFCPNCGADMRGEHNDN